MEQLAIKQKKRLCLLLFILVACLCTVLLFAFGISADSPGKGASETDERAFQQTEIEYVKNNDSDLETEVKTVRIRPAAAILGEVSASGNVELIHTHQIVLSTEGTIDKFAVVIGEQVQKDEILFTLDSQQADLLLAKAELALELATVDLARAAAKDSQGELAAAEAELLAKEKTLEDVLAGPTETELSIAHAQVNAANANYAELQAGPQPAAVSQALADLKKADVSLREAQSDYNEVKWMPEIGSLPQASQLERATLDAEHAKAVYEQAAIGPTTAELQSALSEQLEAQHNLEQLLLKPTSSEIAVAQASVSQAQARVDQLRNNELGSEKQVAELRVKQALVNLRESQLRKEKSIVRAPFAGTILDILVKPGAHGSLGTVVAEIADTSRLKLTINVAESDISQINVLQEADIKVDAFSNQVFRGRVEHISPVSSSEVGIVNYPVTLQLLNIGQSNIRPGMTAVATLENPELPPNSWFVPSTSLKQQKNRTFITVQRNEKLYPIRVDTGASHGEWTIVQSPELQKGDQVVGAVESFVGEQLEEILGG